MKQEDTKQKILDKALELFAAKGYDSVSVGDIAKAVGIKAPSLYNHFPGKQAIFNAIVESTAAQYEADTDKIDIHVQDVHRDIPIFTEITADALFRHFRKFRLVFAGQLKVVQSLNGGDDDLDVVDDGAASGEDAGDVVEQGADIHEDQPALRVGDGAAVQVDHLVLVDCGVNGGQFDFTVHHIKESSLSKF